MKLGQVGLVGLIILSGCGRASQAHYRVEADTATKVELYKPTPAPPPSLAANAVAPLLAYTYGITVEAPASRIGALKEKTEQACRTAGASTCQIISSSLERVGESISGKIEMKAAPNWLTQLRSGVETDANSAGGRVARSETNAEDLTRQVIDADALLRAKTTLRDRLQILLASRPGGVKDLLEVERELARVQGELDAAQGNLNALRQRVATSTLTLDYTSGMISEGSSPGGILRSALRSVAENSARGLASVIVAVALVWPWLLIGAGMIWAIRRWRRGARSRGRHTGTA